MKRNRRQRHAEWHQFFDYMGFSQECEDQQPGYTVGMIAFYIVLGIGSAALAWGTCWKIQ